MAQRLSYAAAFVDALGDEMRSDPRVNMVGSCPLGLGPERLLTNRLRDEFEDRIFDPPTAEAAIAALGVGASMAGLRPFVDLLTGSFAYLSWMQILNEAANVHLMSGGRLQAPVTFHCLEGVRGAGAPQHSQSLHAMMWNAPGIEIAVPATAADAYGLIRTAIRSPNPTFVFSHAKILKTEWDVPRDLQAIPFGRAEIKRPGRDVTVVGISIGLHHALAAADILADQGIDVEVIDPRTLVPFDEGTVIASVRKTGRLVVVDEAPLRAGTCSEIAATIAEKAFASLRAPIIRVARPDIPIPFSPPLEHALTPGSADVVTAVRKVLNMGAANGDR